MKLSIYFSMNERSILNVSSVHLFLLFSVSGCKRYSIVCSFFRTTKVTCSFTLNICNFFCRVKIIHHWKSLTLAKLYIHPLWLWTYVTTYLPVPDRRSRIIPEVVQVRRWTIGILGIWRGEGLGEGRGKGGQFTSNLRPRWTIPVTARRVPIK